MKDDAAALRIDLLESFERMLTSLNAFCSLVRHDISRPAWVSRTEVEIDEKLDMRTKSVRLYNALWYENGQDGRETLTCPGIVGASRATIEAATACNDTKDAFKQAVLALKRRRKAADVDALISGLHQRNEEVAATMKRMGAARLNLKQAYRHVPVLESRPVKIGFTWSKQGRTIQRTSVAEARRLLERRNETPQTRLELRRLDNLPEAEVLARVRSVCPHLRANVVFDKALNSVERRLLQAPLPILIPLQAGEPLPEFVPIPPQPTGSLRLQRSDVRIEEDAFLPSIRVHRYQQRYRGQT